MPFFMFRINGMSRSHGCERVYINNYYRVKFVQGNNVNDRQHSAASQTSTAST